MLFKSRSKKLIDKIAKEYQLDKRVVDYVIRHFFRYLRKYIQEDTDRPLMVRYFGKFAKRNLMTKIQVEKPKIGEILIIKFKNNYGGYGLHNAVLKEDGYYYMWNRGEATEKLMKRDDIISWRYAI